ncbi:MAG TPA: hypothetical protein VJB95_00060 [Candidatus Paceibacterota bacterium]
MEIKTRGPVVASLELVQVTYLDVHASGNPMGLPPQTLLVPGDEKPEVGDRFTRSDGITYVVKPEEKMPWWASSYGLVTAVEGLPNRPTWSNEAGWYVGTDGRRYRSGWTRG